MKRGVQRLAKGMISAAVAFNAAHIVAAADIAASVAATWPSTQDSVDLRIVVTAVQGQAEDKPSPDRAWQMCFPGQVLAEGCQFRTGPQGTVQFTVGSDQVFRVDRLSLVQVLRANLVNGQIKTDVGMTYGRVSKDVDAPIRPHDDTIISPTSTLAVRGTRVSLYDQPPYEPEAVSLTGAAVFDSLRGQLVQFGAKNAGTAKVSGDANSAAQYQLQQTVVDPSGEFSGQTAVEQQSLDDQNRILNKNFASLLKGQTKFTSLVGIVTDDMAFLQFPMTWTDSQHTLMNSSQTEVFYMVQSPQGEIVTQASLGTTPSGGSYVSSGQGYIANEISGFGAQEIDWGLTKKSFPIGTYTITETLEGALVGTTIQTLSQNPTIKVTTTTYLLQTNASTSSQIEATSVMAKLNASHPTVVYTVTAPVTPGEPITPVVDPNSVRADIAKARPR